MAQTGGILMLNGLENPEKKRVFFMGINNAKFRKTVMPGDQLVLEVSLTNRRSKTFVLSGKAYVDGYVVAEAEMMIAIVDRLDGQPTPPPSDLSPRVDPKVDSSHN
jgi:UDP-3-O-[3-hydroxymyristoyl] N-acetylglucosamine deacetylase/3-hydroxyacyl-[acyl-carrier-protein] dehydratase